jgi:hypothetical protein
MRQARREQPPNKRLKLTCHSSLLPPVLLSGGIIRRFQLPSHRGRQLGREPLGVTRS